MDARVPLVRFVITLCYYAFHYSSILFGGSLRCPRPTIEFESLLPVLVHHPFTHFFTRHIPVQTFIQFIITAKQIGSFGGVYTGAFEGFDYVGNGFGGCGFGVG